MKDSQKRWQPNSKDSVIATLMGFDEPRSMQSFHENKRVLSESYTRKVDSIALRPGSLVSIGRSCSTKNKNVFDECVNSSTSNVRTSGRRAKPAGASLSKSLSGDRKLFGKKDEHSAVRHVLRYQQKLKHDSLAGHFGIDSMSNSLNFPLEIIDKPHLFSTSISGFKPKSQKVAYDHVKLDVNSKPGYRQHGKSLVLRSGKPHHKELVVSSTVSPRHSCASCTRNMNRISSPERHRSKFEEMLKTGYKIYSHDSHLLPDQSSLPNKSSMQNFERWKTAKEVQEFKVSGRNQTLNEIFALTDKKSNLDLSLGRSGSSSPSSLQSRTSGCRSPSVYSRIDVVGEIFSNGWSMKQDESIVWGSKFKVQKTSQRDILESESRSREQLQTSLAVDDAMSPSSKVSEFSNCDFSCFGSSFNNPETYIQSVRDHIENCFGYDSCKEIEPSQRNSKSSISREASFNEFFEEETAYSNCSGVGPLESLENLERTNQHSPDSVLESYDAKNLPSFECFDSIGLRLQLEALNFESEETHSEGSVIAVSGEEASEEQFGDLSHDGRNVKRWPRDEDSRNYSYMVDVLDEAGFYYANSFMDFSTWASLECPISPSAFNTLEKKYGKQMSWEKSERQLLFDRLNSGLLSIFNPVINFHAGATSIRRKFRSSFRRDEVEEELWMMLISEEDEKSKDLSEKALDQCLEWEEGISIICGELESSLFDELVMELARFWD